MKFEKYDQLNFTFSSGKAKNITEDSEHPKISSEEQKPTEPQRHKKVFTEE